MEVRYRIVNKDKQIIFCNLYPTEISRISEISQTSQKNINGNLRCGKISNESGTVYAFSSDKSFLKSSAKFKTTIEIIAHSITVINDIVQKANDSINKSTSRLIHNLTSLNAHNIQEIYSLVPQDQVSRKMGGEIAYVEKIIKQESNETARSILRIAKNNAAMKAEFSVFKKLFVSNPSLQKREHNVHKVLMNVFYLFFSDFNDKEVKVIVGEDKNIYMAYFDYESIHVALYHLVENAAKYIKPRSTLSIAIKDVDEHIDITFEMMSLEIKTNEKERIFEEGISGDLAKRIGKAGDGIGMNRAKRILELNRGDISVAPHPDTSQAYMGITYQKNIFKVRLPRRK